MMRFASGMPLASPCGVATTFTLEAINQITSTIISGAIRVHRTLGPGLLENAYLACLCYELKSEGLRFETQKGLPLFYNGARIECAYRADLIVEHAVVVEVKAVDTLPAAYTRQLRTYASLADCRVGLLLNFGAPTLKDGIKRIVNGFPA
jgi:GxxExxY protein